MKQNKENMDFVSMKDEDLHDALMLESLTAQQEGTPVEDWVAAYMLACDLSSRKLRTYEDYAMLWNWHFDTVRAKMPSLQGKARVVLELQRTAEYN